MEALEAMQARGIVAFLIAGTLSAGIAALHIVIVFVGAPGYRYFGAGEAMARGAEAGSWAPAGLTVLVALAFGVFAAYGFAAARRLPRLPLLRTGLVGIAAIYTLRGVSAVPQGLALVESPALFPTRYVVFSSVALVVGLTYWLGIVMAWASLGKRVPGAV
jgi:hypothetical protein